MADVVVIPKGAELHEQLRHLFEASGEIGEHSQPIAPDHLSMLRKSIDANLKPAPLADIRKAVAVLVASFKIPSNLEDPPMLPRLMINDLAMYPADILDEAIRRARRMFKWLPSIAEMVEICDQLVGERRSWLHTADQMMEEHHRRRKRPSGKTTAGAYVMNKRPAFGRFTAMRSQCRPTRLSSPPILGQSCAGQSGKCSPGTRA